MRLPRRTRSCCSSSAKRDHSRNAITAGSPASTGRNRYGSVRSPPAATRASRRSSLAPARLTRSRRRSSCLGLIACTAKPRSRRVSTTGPCGTSIATATRPGSPAIDTSSGECGFKGRDLGHHAASRELWHTQWSCRERGAELIEGEPALRHSSHKRLQSRCVWVLNLDGTVDRNNLVGYPFGKLESTKSAFELVCLLAEADDLS